MFICDHYRELAVRKLSVVKSYCEKDRKQGREIFYALLRDLKLPFQERYRQKNKSVLVFNDSGTCDATLCLAKLISTLNVIYIL